MTKAYFDTTLDKAASGDAQAMRNLAGACFQMAGQGMDIGDTAGAKFFMDLGSDWKSASETGLKNSNQLKELTRNTFDRFW